MNKKLLIISPYFPPTNAADMQRVRMSLPYFASCGWEAEVVMVDEQFSNLSKDELLLKSVPADIKIHKVAAINKKMASILGMGGIALRSIWHYRKTVSKLLKTKKYDLIYFSTTQFPVCILGAYWKKRFGIPYVIDKQDPWHSTYYQDKPKHEQPPKYWFSYRLNKYLEPIALKSADGLISVSEAYIHTLKTRYPQIKNIPASTITFGYFEPDIAIAEANRQTFNNILGNDACNVVYIGRGGVDMHKAIIPVFMALKNGLQNNEALFSKIKFYFIGTSYAPNGMGMPSIIPLAQQYSVADNVIEITDRISYYHALHTLQLADALFICGSDDAQYTASKIYPYLLVKKPLLAIFHPHSSAVEVIKQCTENATVLTLNDEPETMAYTIYQTLSQWAHGELSPIRTTQKITAYSAENLTRRQCELFDRVLEINSGV